MNQEFFYFLFDISFANLPPPFYLLLSFLHGLSFDFPVHTICLMKLRTMH